MASVSVWWHWVFGLAIRDMPHLTMHEEALDICVHADSSDGNEFTVTDIEMVDLAGTRFSLADEAPHALYDKIKNEVESDRGKLHDKLTDAYKDSQPTLADDTMATAWKAGR